MMDIFAVRVLLFDFMFHRFVVTSTAPVAEPAVLYTCIHVACG